MVPASHNRACTPEEQACIGAGFVTEEEAAGGGEFSGMPGGVTVRMELGDVCYFVRPHPHLPPARTLRPRTLTTLTLTNAWGQDAGIIHRGWNPSGINRWTMHHVSWRADAPIMWDCATQTTCRL